MNEREKEREKERMECINRNEKNKIWRKRIKIYNTGALVMLLLEALLAMFVLDGKLFVLYIMGGLLVVWLVWLIIGYIILPCPHCGESISHLAARVDCCPYCGTKLRVFMDLELPEDER